MKDNILSEVEMLNIERGVSKKMIEAERYVDKYILKYGKPPTYRNVASALNLNSPCASFNRLKRYRKKMKNNL